MPVRLCNCGSGRERFPLVDAAGIFCAFICASCEKKTMAKYNPAIFVERAPYAVSGEEDDIGRGFPGDDY